MTKKLVTLIAAGLLLASTGLMARDAAGRQDRMKHARFGIHMAEKNLFPGHMLLKFKDQIGLTEKQVDKIGKMQDVFMESAIKRKADIKIMEMKMNSYLKNDQVDRKKLETMIRDIAKMKTDMQIDHINYLLDLKDLLTAEQIQEIEEFKKQRHKRTLNGRWPMFRDRREDRK